MSAAGKVDLVLVPTDLEGALECTVLAPRLAAAGHEIRWGVHHPGGSLGSWGWLPSGLPETALDDDHGPAARYLLFSGSHEVSSALARSKGRERILLRPTGVDVFRSYRRGYPRMYRAMDRMLMRSRLEVAELGDRPHRLLGSGAALGPIPSRPAGTDATVLVTDEVAGLADPRAWLDAVVGGVRAAGRTPALVGSERASRVVPQVVPVNRNPELLTGTVVMPPCHEVALVRALGGSPVVVSPGFDPAHFSPVWVDAHPPTDPEHLADRLSDGVPSDRAGWCDGLVRLGGTGTADDWATAFAAAIG